MQIRIDTSLVVRRILLVIFVLPITAVIMYFVFTGWTNSIALTYHSYEGEGAITSFTKTKRGSVREGGRYLITVPVITFKNAYGQSETFISNPDPTDYLGKKVKVIIPTTPDGHAQEADMPIWFNTIALTVFLIIWILSFRSLFHSTFQTKNKTLQIKNK